jgi:hypothetical protein
VRESLFEQESGDVHSARDRGRFFAVGGQLPHQLVADRVRRHPLPARQQRPRLPLNQRGGHQQPLDIQIQVAAGSRFHVFEKAGDQRRRDQILEGDLLLAHGLQQPIERPLDVAGATRGRDAILFGGLGAGGVFGAVRAGRPQKLRQLTHQVGAIVVEDLETAGAGGLGAPPVDRGGQICEPDRRRGRAGGPDPELAGVSFDARLSELQAISWRCCTKTA